ncbi:MAG: SRPBCC family protein [Solirubrobacterales bacterium]|nr:SRPBCC family protein [Solirubrobacterales bacterium]
MATVEAAIEVPAALADTWDLFFDADRWGAWVDQFAVVVSAEEYPQAGGRLVWRSTPAGRGQVIERVTEHEPRSLHVVEYEDPESTGSLETRFGIAPGPEPATQVRQRLTYRLTGGGPLAPITDFLFIRSQMRGSLERSLGALRLEANG